MEEKALKIYSVGTAPSVVSGFITAFLGVFAPHSSVVAIADSHKNAPVTDLDGASQFLTKP